MHAKEVREIGGEIDLATNCLPSGGSEDVKDKMPLRISATDVEENEDISNLVE